MKNETLTKSEIFTAYNKARAAARRDGDLKRIERLNKALGILLSKDYYTGEKADYQPTTHACGCNDMKYRHAARRGAVIRAFASTRKQSGFCWQFSPAVPIIFLSPPL